MTSGPLRLAIFGAGIMGSNHARVARLHPGVELVAVVDADIERARRLAGDDAAAAASLAELDVDVEAAVVAVPTAAHAAVAINLCRRGVHLLVEKPLAPDTETADRMIAAARDAGVVLAVGHVERFNAAVSESRRLIDRPIHVHAARIGPYSPRIDDGVIFDLMIHDLDIVASIAAPDDHVVAVSGVATAVNGRTEDLATVTLAFRSGLTASFITSRLGQQKVRTIEITQADDVVSLDLLRQDVTIQRLARHEYNTSDGTSYRQSSTIEIPFIDTRGEPLARELDQFVQCVRFGADPVVSGEDGRRAVEMAQRAVDAVAHVRAGG